MLPTLQEDGLDEGVFRRVRGCFIDRFAAALGGNHFIHTGAVPGNAWARSRAVFSESGLPCFLSYASEDDPAAVTAALPPVRVVEAVRIPVTGNGDARSMAEARQMVAATGCVSVMIGRGALGSPWIFDEAFDTLSPEDREPPRPGASPALRPDPQPLPRDVRPHPDQEAPGVVHGLGHAARCRAEIFQTRSPDEVWGVFQTYWGASGS